MVFPSIVKDMTSPADKISAGDRVECGWIKLAVMIATQLRIRKPFAFLGKVS
jgi:hypothetical protein